MSESIADPMTDNTALREILGEVRGLEALLKGQYDDVPGAEDVAVTDAIGTVRAANTLAVKTLVTNTGDQDVLVYEGGALVRQLEPKETWESALNGQGAITAKCLSGLSSTVAVATYTKDE